MKNHDAMNILSKFGESFCELLGEQNIKEFSQTVKIDLSTLYKYKKGLLLPTLRHALSLADTFSCSLDYLFGLTDHISHYHKPTPPFSIAFRNVLAENECTRYRLCKDKRISTRSVDDWFHGRRHPSIDKLIQMASYFHCTLEHLIGRE